jgi:outer membrane protein TolC
MRPSFRHAAPALLAAALLSTPLDAQRPDLPLPELVAAALDNHPTVLAATARVAAAEAQAGMLGAGPHEVNVTGSYARRSIDTEGTLSDFDATISRPFRLPAKARLDRKAGALGIEAARDRMADVRHETALLLSRLWYDWLIASALVRNDESAVANLERAQHAVDRRIRLRDASTLDDDQARAALALARGQLLESRARASAARASLAASFPDLALPAEAPALAEPAIAPEALEELRDQVIEHSHEIGAARADAGRYAVLADRARADRIADPSLGIRLFSERSGTEKGAGVTASIPLGGRHRARAADHASAVARAASFELAAVEREIEAIANTNLSNARTLLSAWSEIAEAARHSQAVTERTARGLALGAIDLADLLYAERQAQEARRAEINARGEALRAILKLEIDAHSIWAKPA